MNKETIKELREQADEMISAGIANKVRNVWSLVENGGEE